MALKPAAEGGFWRFLYQLAFMLNQNECKLNI
ncbi:hypothetical protein GGE33_003365 [Rhizobium cellulosilyticum]|uniref:Uncharacterized protein n=1 Tax=Aliirhizobium cellulosilyticum TaxID=393664 RepID=A0A7W6SAR5_9HYPH|nr:hypothetical protein [Rhizobium cellulosilyticum]